MLGHGSFISSEKETMLYRENPNSESHVLNEKERIIGAAVALSRIFCSNEFNAVLDVVARSKQEAFASQLITALEHRIPKSELLNVVENLALEQMILKWGYSNRKISKLLGRNYAEQLSSQTVHTLNNLSGNSIRIKPKQKLIKNQSTSSRIWDFYFNKHVFKSQSINKIFLKIIYRIIFIMKPNHRMKNKWR
jgi:hypothetical protein